MFKKFKSYIEKSLSDVQGKTSHTKISSYLILFTIIITCLTFISIDLINAIAAWNNEGTYEIPISHVTIFGMILAHHLYLLGIKKKSEDKQYHDKCELEKHTLKNDNKEV